MFKGRVRYFEHSNGTKFYELVSLSSDDLKKAGLFHRFGRIGSKGKADLRYQGSPKDIYSRELREHKVRQGRGYTEKTVFEFDANDLTEILAKLDGRVSLQTEIEKFMTGIVETAIMGDSGDVSFDEDLEPSAPPERKKTFHEIEQEKYSDNPNWGIF